MLLLSLVKEIEIIGEAANRVSADACASLPGVPWPDLIGMRHRLIHAYADVNLDVVWATVVADLPGLICELEVALSNFPDATSTQAIASAPEAEKASGTCLIAVGPYPAHGHPPTPA